MNRESNIKLLIKIILYLLLALAFFSNYAIKSEELKPINFMITIVFLFGILALICLYIGLCSKTNYLRELLGYLGYVFAGSFMLSFGWYVLNTIVPNRNFLILLNPELSTTIWVAVLAPLFTLGFLIIKEAIKR
ncbi:MAG: hypothetical protein ABIH37_03555, partial [archaeon]